MNETNPMKPIDDDAPDAFERVWMDTLAKPDPELEATRESFVDGVLARHQAGQARPAVAGRIGVALLPYAAAAAIAIAAVAGWFVLKGGTNQSGPNDLAHQPDAVQAPSPQPPVPDAVVPADAKPIPLGKLIAQTRSTVTAPANELTTVVRDTPENLQVRRLLDLIDNPVPDLKELLAPLDTTDDPQQSRA